MDRRLDIVTLGVRDLDRAVRFYRDGLGWKPAVEMGDFLLFELGGVTFAQYVASRAEVDWVLASACAAGAALLLPASPRLAGSSAPRWAGEAPESTRSPSPRGPVTRGAALAAGLA